MPLYRRVEVPSLGLCRGERIENDGIFPCRQLAGAGCELDRSLAVTQLRVGTSRHEHRAGVVRLHAAGIKPNGLSELIPRSLVVPEVRVDEPQVVVCLHESGIERDGLNEMSLRLAILPLAGEDRPQAVVGISVAGIKPQRLGEMGGRRLVLPLFGEREAQVVVSRD